MNELFDLVCRKHADFLAADDESCETTAKVTNLLAESNDVSGGDLHRRTTVPSPNAIEPEPEETACDDTLPQPDESREASEWLELKSPVDGGREMMPASPVKQSLIENPRVAESQSNETEVNMEDMPRLPRFYSIFDLVFRISKK